MSTRNFVNATLRSERMGASLLMTRTYNKLALVHRTNGSRLPLPLGQRLEPRQAGYMAYTAPNPNPKPNPNPNRNPNRNPNPNPNRNPSPSPNPNPSQEPCCTPTRRAALPSMPAWRVASNP